MDVADDKRRVPVLTITARVTSGAENGQRPSNETESRPFNEILSVLAADIQQRTRSDAARLGFKDITVRGLLLSGFHH